MLHDPADGSAEALVALRHVDDGIDPGPGLVDLALGLSEFLVRCGKPALFAGDLAVQVLLSELAFTDLPCHSLKTLLQILQDLLLDRFRILGFGKSLFQLFLPGPGLLGPGRVGSKSGFDGSSFVDQIQNADPGMIQGRALFLYILYQLLQVCGSLFGPCPDPVKFFVCGGLAAGKTFDLAFLFIQTLLQLVPALHEML